MDKNQYKKFMRNFFILWGISLLAIIGLLFWLQSKQPAPQINNYIGQKGDSAYQLAQAQGFRGSLSDYLASLHGNDGHDSISTVKTVEKPTIVETTNTILKTEIVPAPAQEPSPVVQQAAVEDVRTNPLTCDVEIKFSGTRGYQVLISASRLLGGCGID